MLTLTDRRFARSPSVLGRRDFLRIGGLCGLTLPQLLASRRLAAGTEARAAASDALRTLRHVCETHAHSS